MNKERVYSAEELISHRSSSGWAGDFKLKTKDCGSCRFHLRDGDGETCEWGRPHKRLTPTERPRHCGLLKGSSPREEEIIRQRRLAKQAQS